MTEILKSIAEFFSENWTVIKDNWPTFLYFGVLVFILSEVIIALIYKKRYKDLPERNKLYRENNALKKENLKLKEQVRDLTINERMLEGIRSSKKQSTIGEKIAKISK